jgi:hypothetical protein
MDTQSNIPVASVGTESAVAAQAPVQDPNMMGGSSVDAAMAAAQAQAAGGSKRTFWTIVIILVILIAIATAYLFYSRSQEDEDPNNNNTPEVVESLPESNPAN